MREMVKVSAPGKLMLFGEHAVIYHRPCIVTAVDQRMIVEIKPAREEKLLLDAPGVGIKGYSKKIKDLACGEVPKGVRFIETGIRNFFQKYKVKQGIEVKTKAGFSSEVGFGSSAAVTVGVAAGLAQLFKIRLSRKQLFDLTYKTVLDVQGVGSGFDLAASIWGGTLYFVTGGKKVIPLKINQLPLIVGYTGIKADTPTMVKKVANLRKNNKKLVDSIFDQMSFLTNKAKVTLSKGNFKKTGGLMNLNQGLLDALGVNTKELADLIFATRKAGAWGAKLSGAGGGDCMIALVPGKMRRKAEKAIERAGGKALKIKPNAEGVRAE